MERGGSWANSLAEEHGRGNPGLSGSNGHSAKDGFFSLPSQNIGTCFSEISEHLVGLY